MTQILFSRGFSVASQAMARCLYERLVLFSASTCGKGGPELGADESEVCLLAWQVIDTANIQAIGNVEECFVRPNDMPSQKTRSGIDVANLSQAPMLDESLKSLQKVVSTLPAQSFCLATNGGLPLRQCLFPELSRKRIPPLPFLYSYFDLQQELCKRSANEFQAQTLQDLCRFVGVECPSGDVQGGEEIKILAKVVTKMLSQGHVFESPETIMSEYDNSANLDTAEVIAGHVVRLRGLPFQADYKDLAGFLSGLNIINGGLAFGINAVGRRTGEALVVLESPEHANLALQRHRHYMNDRYVEVYEASPDEFLRIADGGNDLGDVKVSVVRMQGLPYRATEDDIVEFFGGDAPVKNSDDGVLIVRYPNGRASGDAFVVFNNNEDMEAALAKNRGDMMGRYVELFKSSLKEFFLVLNKSGSPEQLDQFSFLNPDTSSASCVVAAKRGSERNCVKLRGLPWSSSPEDVVEFFDDLNKHIEQHGIHMVLNSQNRPTGDCYVQMSSVDAAFKAADKLHRKNMGRRYIEVFQCSGNEVTFALMDSAGTRSGGSSNSSSGGGYGGGYSGGGGGYKAGKRRRPSAATVKARGLPFSTSEYDLVDFFCDYGVEPSDVEIVYNNAGRSTGIAFISLASQTDARHAVKELNNKYIGHRYIELSLC